MHFHEDAFVGQMLVYLRSFYIYSPTFFASTNGRYPQGNQANILTAGPWGTGPYRVVKVTEKGAVSFLEANPDYWQSGYPRTPHLEIYSPGAVDGATAYQWMIEGKADLFDAGSPSMLPLLREHQHLRRAIKYPTSHLTTLFNTRKPASALRDLRVRQAINMLVDRRTLLRFVTHESARMVAFILPLEEANGLQPYPYDPKKAGELLQASGYNDTHPLPLVIGYFISEEKLAKAIGAMLEGKGISVEFERYQTRQEYYKHIKNYTHGPDNPIEGERWDLSIVQSGLYTNTVATHFEAFYGAGGNRWIETDATADRLFLHAMHAPNQENAQKRFAELEVYLYEQHYSMPLFIWPSIFIMHQRISDNSYSGSGYLLNLKEIGIAL
jgi:ABC-type transport system substrate-binding protein